jgi:RNA polymerase sigma factor (sigma-70 family)
MLEEESVTTWIAHLKVGHTDASREIWQRYVEQLVRFARRKLGSTPRRGADEEDVVVSAFEEFLAGVEEGRFLRLDDRDDLWQVLLMLTERRAIALRRREMAMKRGGGEVRGESVYADLERHGSHRAGLHQEPDPEPSPAFAAEMTEQLRFLLDQLGDPLQQRIALGKLEGKTNQELADQLGIGLRSVQRKLSMIRDKWRGVYGNE